MKESQIQRAIVGYLEAVLPPHYRVYANANASRRTTTGRAANAVPGLRRGIPDLTIRGPGGLSYDIEIKSAKGRLSPEQSEWGTWVISIGGRWACVHSVEEVRLALNEWQIKTREAA